MKKFSLLIALTLLAGGFMLSPSTTYAQDDKQTEFERDWYPKCYGAEKNEDKCYQLSKELVAKYPTSQYRKNADSIIKTKDLNTAWQKFNAALEAFYKQSPLDPAKLESLFAVGDAFLQVEPDQQSPFHLFALGQMGLAGHRAAIQRAYQNLDKVKGYIERSMKAFESAQPAQKTRKDFDTYVAPLKDLVMANGYQFLGYQLTETNGDQEQALNYLTKAIQVKGREGAGWKDPNNYWLRSTIYSTQYSELRKPYDAMTDEEKVSDAGKEVLKKVNELIDTKLIPEYARVLATATSQAAKPFYDVAKPEFDKLWEFRTGDIDKAADYIKNYITDPTIASLPIPAKPDDSSALAPTAPTAGGAKVNLSGAGAGATPGANTKGATNGNGKSKPANGKSKPARRSSKGKKRGRG